MKAAGNWIKLSDWRKVHFPEVCPYSGLEPDRVKEYYVDDSSFLWRIINVVARFGQYITLEVPFHSNGIKEWRKRRIKAILKGVLIGFLLGLVFIFGGIAFMVEVGREAVLEYRLGMMIGGIGFVACLILFPVWFDYKVQQAAAPVRMRKKRDQLWVKITNSDYRKKFLVLNDFMVIPEDKDSVILDKDFV